MLVNTDTAGQSIENSCLWGAEEQMGHLLRPTPQGSEMIKKEGQEDCMSWILVRTRARLCILDMTGPHSSSPIGSDVWTFHSQLMTLFQGSWCKLGELEPCWRKHITGYRLEVSIASPHFLLTLLHAQSGGCKFSDSCSGCYAATFWHASPPHSMLALWKCKPK